MPVTKKTIKDDKLAKEEKPATVVKNSKKLVEKLVEKSVETPVEIPVEIPVEKPVKKTNKKSVEKPVEKIVEKPVGKPIEKTDEKALEKPKKGKKALVSTEAKVKPTPVVEEKVPKKVSKKPIEKVNVNTTDEEDENNLKEWKKEWATIVQQISDLQKTQQNLEASRDELVKKMAQYLSSKKGTTGENILDSNNKMKKIITKVDTSLSKIEDNDDDSDTSEDLDNNSESEDDTDDATPAEPLKKGRQPIKFTSKNKKNLDDSDSE